MYLRGRRNVAADEKTNGGDFRSQNSGGFGDKMRVESPNFGANSELLIQFAISCLNTLRAWQEKGGTESFRLSPNFYPLLSELNEVSRAKIKALVEPGEDYEHLRQVLLAVVPKNLLALPTEKALAAIAKRVDGFMSQRQALREGVGE